MILSADQLHVGRKAELFVLVSEEMVDAFAALSGDDARLHTDAEYARAAGFEGRIAHGMLVAALLSRFVGKHLPGEGAVWLKSDLSFVSPCYFPAELRISGEIVGVSEAVGKVVTVRSQVEDRDGRIILRANTLHKVLLDDEHD